MLLNPSAFCAWYIWLRTRTSGWVILANLGIILLPQNCEGKIGQKKGCEEDFMFSSHSDANPVFPMIISRNDRPFVQIIINVTIKSVEDEISSWLMTSHTEGSSVSFAPGKIWNTPFNFAYREIILSQFQYWECTLKLFKVHLPEKSP